MSMSKYCYRNYKELIISLLEDYIHPMLNGKENGKDLIDGGKILNKSERYYFYKAYELIAEKIDEGIAKLELDEQLNQYDVHIPEDRLILTKDMHPMWDDPGIIEKYRRSNNSLRREYSKLNKELEELKAELENNGKIKFDDNGCIIW